MTKISFLGAGSTVFAKRLLVDILSFDELRDATISLHDIDDRRLRESEVMAHRIGQALGIKPTIEIDRDRRRSLDGADYAIGMFQIGGYRPSTVIDFEIPRRYGLRQTIGDTVGIGGIFRALRTIPVMLAMCRDMDELCPDVTFLNYVNPMAMNTWAVNRATNIRMVGLCHSVPGTAKQLARDMGIPAAEVNYVVAGINHMAFFLSLERDGENLYPLLQQVYENKRYPLSNTVRYEMFARLGYFVTESSEHFSEYVPWFIKRDRPDLIERYHIPLDEYIGRCEAQILTWEYIQNAEADPQTYTADALKKELDAIEMMPVSRGWALNEFVSRHEVNRSVEYGSGIIHSLETGTPRVVYANVINKGIIDNLPEGCCVEVPCLVDKNGIQPVQVGQLPPQLAALMQTNINVQALTVEAVLTGNREHVYHAAMLDPHTAAELDLPQIWQLVDELIAAHGTLMPESLRI
jgi:alpha-galactosidase